MLQFLHVTNPMTASADKAKRRDFSVTFRMCYTYAAAKQYASENGKPQKRKIRLSRQSASGLGDAKDVSFSFLATICEVISEAGCWNTEILLV